MRERERWKEKRLKKIRYTFRYWILNALKMCEWFMVVLTWTAVQSAMALHRMAENAFRFIFLFALLFFSLFIVFFCVCLSFHPWLLIPLDLQHDNILNICCITLPRYVNWNALEGKLLIALTCTHKVDSVYLPFFFVCACTFSRFISFSFEIRVYFPCPSAVATNTAARSYVGILQNLCLWLTPWIILHTFALTRLCCWFSGQIKAKPFSPSKRRV